ncbi:MAG: hypothetical protein HYT73_04070 [Candidatus Aenigmarchaeota archaeon]|nr:hypothetical protein [Candidatus Aenigmarchaeota archaeon]
MSYIFGIFSYALSAAGNDVKYNGMKGLKSIGIFMVAASFIIAFSLSVLASTSSNFTNGGAPAAYFKVSQYNLVLNVTLPDGTNGGAEDTILRDGSIDTWSGYALSAFNASTYFVNASTGESYSGSQAIIYDVNGNGIFNSGTDIVMTGSAPADGSLLGNTWGNAKFAGTATFDATSDIYDDTTNAGTVDKRIDKAIGVVFENSGTATDTDGVSFKAWNDTDSNGIFDRFIDKQIGIPSAISPTKWNLTDGFLIQAGGRRIFVTADITVSANGKTLQMGIPLNGMTVASSNDGPTDAAVVNANIQTADTSAPAIISSSITPASPVRTNTVLNVTCTDNTPRTVTYNIDSSANVSLPQTGGSFTGTIDISPVSDGSHTINVFCSDAANNTATSGLSFTVDKTQPSVSINILFSTTINNTAKTDNLSFSGPFSDSTTNIQSGDYSLDGGAPVSLPALNGSYGNDMNLNYSFTLSSAADGQHTVSVRAFDVPGNVGSASYTFFVDTEVPVSSVNLTSPYKTARVFQLPYLANDSVQTSGIQNVTLYYRINQSGSYTTYENTTNGTFNFDATLLGDGFYEFYTVARDNAGNIEAVPALADANTTIDTVMPFITSLATTDTPEFINGTDIWFRLSAHSSLSFNATANDTTSRIQICTTIFNSTTASNSGSGAGYNASSAVLGFTFNGITATNDSVVNVTAVCTDKAGLENRSSIIIMLDGMAPTIAMQWNETSNYMHVNATGGLVYSSSMPSAQNAAARGNSNESGSGFRNATFYPAFSDMGSGTISPWEFNYTIDLSDNGNGTINVTVFDNVGNSNSSSLQFAEDNAAPSVSVMAPNGGEVLSGSSSFSIQWAASDASGLATSNVTLEYSANGGTSWATIATEQNGNSYLWTIPAINSNQAVVRVNASDVVQNTGSDTSNATFIIDSSSPTATAFTNDTNANGKIDRIEFQFSEPVNVTSAAGISVAGYSITGAYSSFNVTNLSLTITEDGFDTNSTPLVGITSPTIRDLSGNPLLQNITPSDKARPILLAAKTNDTNLNGKIDVLMLNFSEPINNLVGNLITASDGFSISGYSNPSFISPSRVLANNTGVLNVTSSSTLMLQLGFTENSSFDTNATPTLSVLAGYLADASGNNLIGAPNLAVADGAPPYMTNATTRDSDGNGKIDNITVTFTEALETISVNLLGGDFSVAGYTIINANRTWASIGIVNISVQEKSSFDSNETPIVSFVQGQLLNDKTTNNSITSGSVLPADKVRPVVAFTSGINTPLKAGSYPINITFSENATGTQVYFNSTQVSGSMLNGTFWSGSIEINSSVPDGPHTVSITSATDTSGNVMTDDISASFASDRTLPQITVNSPVQITYNFTANVTLNATFNEAVDMCIAELSGVNATFACNTVSSVLLAEGQNTLRIRANDTAGNMNIVEVTVQFNPHSVPMVMSAGILPSLPNITDTITASAVLDSTTTAIANISFFWYRNGDFVTNNTVLGVANGSNTTNTYNGTFAHFDNITAEIRPYNTAKGFGSFVNVTVQAVNTNPTIVPPSITALLNVTANLSVSTLYSDADGDSGSVLFKFYRNGGLFALTNMTGVASGSNVSSNMTITNLVHFDNWTAEAVSSDAHGAASANLSSVTVQVSNTPPTTGTPLLSTDPFYTNSTITCTPAGGSDADGDAVSHAFAWLINNTIIPGQTAGTLDGTTQFNRGDSIRCQVTPSDGFTSGGAMNSTNFTVQDTPPTMPAFVTSDILKANSSSAFTFTAGGSVDNDTDTITYQYEANHTGSFVNIGNSTGSITWNITNLTSGFFNVRVIASTALNVSGNLTNLTTLEIDTTRLAFIEPTPANNTFTNSPAVVLNVTASIQNLTRVYANVSGTIINMTNSTPSVFSTSITLSDGTYSYFVTAESLSGANTTEVRVVHVDTLTPAISSVEIVSDKPNNFRQINQTSYLVSSLSGIGGGQNLTFTINTSDASTLTVELVNGTQTFSDSTAPYTFILHINMSSISETRNLSINVTDAAGNVNQTSIELIFDNTPPTTTHSLNDSSDLLHLSSPVLYFGDVVSEQLVANGTSSDASSLGTFFSASPYTNVSAFNALTGLWSVTYILNNTSSNGTVSINITDLLGNPASIQLNIAKDASSPSAPAISQMPSLITTASNLSWTLATDTGSGIRGYMVMRSNDNVTYTNVSSMLTATSFNDTSSPEGLVYYKIMAFDNVQHN